MSKRNNGRPSPSRGARVEKRKTEHAQKWKPSMPPGLNRQERRAERRRRKKGADRG